MANPSKPQLPREIRRKLAGLRWRIRAYVALQGLGVAFIWLIITFWIGLAIDYLPVLVGASEMPLIARGVLLAIIGMVLAYILYRWILRRSLIHLGDQSMAVLLERQFRQLDESLITSVELADEMAEAAPFHRQMLAVTQLQALKRLKGLRLWRVFNLRPLLATLAGAFMLSVSLVLLYVVNAAALERGLQRLYLLDDEPWPRQARIEVVGVEATQRADLEGDSPLTSFRQRRVKVARGANVGLVVRADGSAPRVPEVCTISYRTTAGARGRVNMTRIGQIRDGHQLYRYEGKPFRGILDAVRFDVVGYDHRVRDYLVEVVESPAIVGAEIDCVFPDYMVDPTTSSWLPRTVPLTTGLQLPQGTRIRLRADCNKGLQQVRALDTKSDTQRVYTFEGGERSFSLDATRLTENLSLELHLVDSDHVTSERPFRILIEAVTDVPPTVDIALRGIGTAVTPNVLLPLRGTLQDDYGVEQAWVEVQRNDSETHRFDLPEKLGEFSSDIDFRELRRREGGWEIQPQDTLNIVVQANDHSDLGPEPNVGQSEHYRLDVVTDQQLLAMLEARELGLRQRFEQVINEMTETRDALVRVRNEGPERARELLDLTAEGDDSPVDEAARQRQAAQRGWALRLLRAQRALLQSQKSAQETLGVAASFRDIRLELVYNRVDSEDRKERLEQAVIVPLEAIGAEMFNDLETDLNRLIAGMDEQQETTPYLEEDNPETRSTANTCLQQVDAILLAMDQVLQNMLDLETYNELLDIVRSLIEDQQRLIGRTEDERKRQVLDLFQ